jgi:hypothetical protein
MGVIQVPGRLTGRTYNVDISGDTPTETERARILQEVQARESKFLQKYEQQFGKPIPEPEDGTALGRGIARGIPAAKSTLGTTIETIGDKTGIAAIADFGRGMEESAAQREFELALSQPKPITRQDVAATEGFFPKIGAGLTYAGELAGSQIPQQGVGLAGGAAGAIGGFAVGSVPGAIAGFGIGSGLSEAPLLFGANVQRQEQEVAEGRKDAVDLGAALGATVGQAALTGIANAIGAKGLTLVRGGLFTRAAKGAALGAPVEGLNEVGQAVLERHQAGLPIDTPEAIQEYIDNGIAGGVLGGGLGASTGVVAGRGTNAADEAAPTSISSRPVDEIAAAGVIPDATAAPATVSGVRRVTTGRATTTTVGLNDGTDLTLNGDATQADIDRAVSEYNQTRAAAAPIITPAPTVTLNDVPPAPPVKIKKVSYKTTGRKVNKNEKFEATVTLESGETVKFYTGKRRKRDDPGLAADTANQLNPTEVGIGDVRPFAPDVAYPEANVSPEPVDVSRVGMDDVEFMPRGTTTAQPTLPLEAAAQRAEVRPAEMETEAEAMERAEAEANERKIAEAAAMADRLAAAAEAEAAAAAVRAQSKPAVAPAQGGLFGAAQATTIKPGRAIWANADFDTKQPSFVPLEQLRQEPQAAPTGSLFGKKIGDGWKLHLNPKKGIGAEKAISDYLSEKKIPHKVGKNSGQDSKGITVYVGSRDDANALAADINSRFSNVLNDAAGEVLVDDTQIAGKVWGRFDLSKNDEFHQYGAAGVPFLNDDMSQLRYAEDKDAAIEKAKQRADGILRRQYGEYYTGTKPAAEAAPTTGTDIPPELLYTIINRDNKSNSLLSRYRPQQVLTQAMVDSINIDIDSPYFEERLRKLIGTPINYFANPSYLSGDWESLGRKSPVAKKIFDASRASAAADLDALTMTTELADMLLGAGKKPDAPLRKLIGKSVRDADVGKALFAIYRGAADKYSEEQKLLAGEIYISSIATAETRKATNDGEGAAVDPAKAGTSAPGGASRVGEGQGAGSGSQTPEVTTTSGTGGLASDMQPSVAAGATGGTESGALAGVIPDVIPDAKPQPTQRLTPKKALKARLAALSDYFTPGNIVETALGGKDRVRSFDVDADGNWTVTVDAVKEENGQWVLKNSPEDFRTHRTSPPTDRKGNYKAPIERAKPVDEVAADATNQAEVAALRKQHLRQSNPGGDWLKGKQVTASKNPDRKFMVGAVTADIGAETDVFLPTDVLSGLAGLENEVRRAGDPRYDALLADAQENGFDPDQKKNKIVVAVNHYGQAYILEGNTRVAVAKALGVANVKAEVRYWNGGEDVDGPMSPDNVLATIASENNAEQRQADATEQNATDVGMPMAAVASASALDKPLSANTRAFLEAGDLKGALLSLSKETKNPILKALAKAFSRLVGTTRVKVLYPGDPAKNIGSNRGVFWQASAKGDPERQNIIYLNGQTGMTAHVLMHEMAHAVTANVINNPNLPITRQLQDLLNAVRKQVATPGAFGYSYELQGLTNLSEFVADAYGRVAFGPQDNGLRDLMNNTLFTNIKYETNELPLTNFERFKEIIGNFFRGLVGMPSKPYPRRKITNEVRTTETGLDRFHQIMDNILSPAPQVLPSKIFNAAVANPLIGRNVLNNAGRVPTWSPSAASRMYDVIRESIPDWLRNFALSLQQIDWIADFSRKALPVIDEIKSIFDRRQGESARLQKIVSQLPERYSVLAKANPAGFKRYIGILDTATRNQVDITKPRNTYRDDAGKLFIWDKLSTEMRAIDPDGKFREAYNIHIALNDSIRQEWFNAVTLQVNQTTEDPAERTALRDKLMAQLLESGIIDPYFPLMREGKYWVSYVQTETTSRPPTAPGTDTRAALFSPEAVVSTFESIGAARAFIAQLNNATLPDGRPAAVEITQEPFIMDFAKGYDKSVPLEFVQGAIRILDEIVPEASQREAGRAAIIEMFTRMSPAYSAMAQFRSRKDGGRAGAMGYESPIGNVTEPGEYIAALQNRLAGTVNAIVNSKFVPELEAAKSRLRAQAENAQKDPTNTLADKIAINATAKELEKRISFARNPTSSRVAYHARGLTFLWTLGALPAATINVFFQLPMVVIPQLLGRHSLRSIIRALNTARMISQSSGISQLVQEPGQADPTQVKELENWGSLENYYTVDDAGNFILRTDRRIPASLRADLEDLAPLAQYMSRNGMLGTTIAQSELSGMGDVASRIYRFSGLPLQYAERLTRQSTSISAFLLERDKIRSAQGQRDYRLTPEQISDAVKYAVDTTELTNGTVGILTGPSIATSGLGSVLLMYKRYALSMLRFITNGVRRSLTKITPDMTPEQVADAKMERKIARYQLASMIGSTAIFAGIQGLPFFGEATTILDMMFTDDDEEDFKTLAQKSLQEPLYSGLVNYLTGAEVASRISMSGLVFRESPIQKDQSILYDAFEMFGGPVLGTYLNVERGIGLVNDGEVYRGIEAMVPSSIRAFMRAYRYAEAGGAETMRGDQITPLDSWDVAVQLLGYTPEAVIRTQEAVGREKRITEAIRSEKNQLYKRFNLALVDGDYEEVRQVQQEMAEFTREHPELGGFDLKASVRGFRQRSQDMIGGVYIPEPFQPGVRESLDEYGREVPQ